MDASLGIVGRSQAFAKPGGKNYDIVTMRLQYFCLTSSQNGFRTGDIIRNYATTTTVSSTITTKVAAVARAWPEHLLVERDAP